MRGPFRAEEDMTEGFVKTNKRWYLLIAILSALLIVALAVAIFLDQLIVLFTPVKDEVVLEAGSTIFSVEMFRQNERNEITLLSDTASIDFNKVGSYQLNVLVGKRSCVVTLKIIDTTPPTAESVTKQIYTYETVSAEDMITNVSDISSVKAEFATEPKYGSAGKQSVLINVTDEAGNRTTVTSELIIITDTAGPVFSEMADLVVRLGDAISYKKGVTVTDNRDEDVTFTVYAITDKGTFSQSGTVLKGELSSTLEMSDLPRVTSLKSKIEFDNTKYMNAYIRNPIYAYTEN